MTRAPWSIVAAALALLVAGPAGAAVQAGVSAAVRGDIDLLPVVEKVKRPVASGEDIFLGDEISSYDASGMQLMLLDETVFTIGPNTDLMVDEFVYDPATGVGEVTASLAKGVLRFVTGKVAEADPEDVTVNLPVGTIGIRGTTGAAVFDGATATVVLLGPGRENNAAAREGRLSVSAAGETVELIRPRWGTVIEPGQPPSDPFRLTDEQLALILTQLGVEAKGVKGAPSGGTATRAADQDTAAAIEPAVFFQEFGEISEVVEKTVAELSVTAEIAGITTGIQAGIASITDLALIDTGQFAYLGSGPVVGSVGDFEFELEIDFGARTLGGGESFLDFATFTTGGVLVAEAEFDLSVVSFDSGIGGQAVFNFMETQVPGFGFGPCLSACTLDLNVSLVNTGTQLNNLVAAAEVDFSVLDSGGLSVATGMGTVGIFGIASLADLATIQTGQFHYAVFDPPETTGDFGIDFAMNIDFGARTLGGVIGGSKSFLDFFGPVDGAEFDLSSVSFDSGIGGQAVFNVPGTQVLGSGACDPVSSCTLNLEVELLNVGTQADVVAAAAFVDFFVQDSGGNIVASHDDVAPRFDGLIPPEMILDGPTSFDELRSIQTGTFFYEGTGVFTQTLNFGSPASIDGTFSAFLDIDFGARTVGGGSSSIVVNTSGSGGSIFDSTGINLISYANAVGLATKVFDGTDLSNPNFAGTEGGLINSSGIIANQATININYFDSATENAGSGSGTSGPRTAF